MKMKETLQLGKTAFQCVGTCQTVKQNGKRLGRKSLYEQRQKLNEGKPTFVLHDSTSVCKRKYSFRTFFE